MRLSTRILLGYWYLVTLLVLTAAGASLAFHRLGSGLGQVLSENVESVRASTAMLESLERQDSAVLAALLGREGAMEDLQASESAFRSALERARGNVTLADEGPVIEELAERFSEFVISRDRLLRDPPARPLSAYEEETYPRFDAVKNGLFTLLEMNHQAMVDTDRETQGIATRRATTLALVVLLALTSLVLLSRALHRVLLDRLEELAEVAKAIAEGHLERRAAVGRADELGQVARQLNAVLDLQQEARGLVESRVALFRELAVSLLASRTTPAALVGLDGRVLAATPGSDLEELLSEMPPFLPEVGDLRAGEVRELEAGGQGLRVELLHGPSDRVVAWLVSRRSV